MEDFMREYSIWIIVAIIVILMTIIGYIAEKTDFGKKEFSKRTGKKQKKEAKIETKIDEKAEKEVAVPVENPVISSSETVTETLPLDEALENSETKEENINVKTNTEEILFQEPLKDNMEIASENQSIKFESVPNETTHQEDNFDLSFDTPTVEQTPKEEKTFSDTTGFNLDEDLNVPFGDDAKVSIHDNMNLDLPDIDSVKQEVNNTKDEDVEDDDIWKF